ncbi:hypothetical protein HQ39_01995 [Porphyromonas sp. COT-108 OH2963]|uniref:DUF4254 domain-containing protein n=1 Tax=Porphyromonas sp. COT-108 OH2963 TaxID=1515614 RepID=UPI00052E1D0C|nr:DUF4254 domain-containing protein [Porphyromonas sp. COT-108 OH2963]KGN96331.1 hypothetical protein HQ39_01995 [Porphyromonas sp. COT-108 OH2963]
MLTKSSFSAKAIEVFLRAIADYRVSNDIDAPIVNPYEVRSIEFYLYSKNWIDNAQWDMEDIIRNPDIDPVEALAMKRRIDRSNQERTDLVELIDSYFLDLYKDVCPEKDAKINTESPAWALDRMSILQLKIYHMREQTKRTDASEEHIKACEQKLQVLLEQEKDLATAVDELLEDISKGRKYMKVYKQMKMYNDPAMNSLLLGKAGAK